MQLGNLNAPYMQKSPLLKYRSVAKVDPESDIRYQISVVVRENGGFEIYYNFSLVNEYLNPLFQCVDVETDFEQFYLKFVKNPNEISIASQISDLDVEIKRVRHFWRNRIGFSTMKSMS